VHGYRLGVDLGGTKIEAAVLDTAGNIADRQRVATPAGYDAAVDAIVALVEGMERRHGRATVGLATPGARSLVDGRMKNCNSTCLNGRPLKEDHERRLGRDVRMENDANCFALSEATDGAACGAHVVFGVILGTGVGGAIVVGGRVLTGANAIAGEWGHNPLPLPEAADLPLRPCYCGRRGCIETYLCGGAWAKDGGDAYVPRLARSLAGVVNILDPDAIVLGGGVSNVERLYTDVAPLLKRFVLSDDVRTRILRPMYGDSSGVRGAAWLWNE
jgi:predicted NBD/HSP70 family sugar kinase